MCSVGLRLKQVRNRRRRKQRDETSGQMRQMMCTTPGWEAETGLESVGVRLKSDHHPYARTNFTPRILNSPLTDLHVSYKIIGTLLKTAAKLITVLKQ